MPQWWNWGCAFRMWGNSIGDEGAEAFAEALRRHPSMTNLRWASTYTLWKQLKKKKCLAWWPSSAALFQFNHQFQSHSLCVHHKVLTLVSLFQPVGQQHHISRWEVPGRSAEGKRQTPDLLVGRPRCFSRRHSSWQHQLTSVPSRLQVGPERDDRRSGAALGRPGASKHRAKPPLVGRTPHSPVRFPGLVWDSAAVFVCRLINNRFTADGLRLLAEALPHNTALKEIWWGRTALRSHSHSSRIKCSQSLWLLCSKIGREVFTLFFFFFFPVANIRLTVGFFYMRICTLQFCKAIKKKKKRKKGEEEERVTESQRIEPWVEVMILWCSVSQLVGCDPKWFPELFWYR